MRARLLLNLVLLLAVIGLGLFFWHAPEKNGEPRVAISDIRIDQIETIRLLRNSQEVLALERDAGNWRLREPFIMDADNNRAEGLLMVAAIASEGRHDRGELDLSRYGLEPEQTVLYLDEHRFVIGDEHPLQAQRYVLFQDQVHLVPDTLFRELQAPATYFANGKLLPVAETPSRIILPDRTLTRDDTEWQADPPLEHRSPNAAGNAWRTAYAMTVSQYRDEPASVYGEIVAEFERAEPITLQIVSLPPNIILARPELGIQYHLDSDQVARLLLTDE